MIEQPAKVVEVGPEAVQVRTEMSGGCQSCSSKGGCGTSLVSQLFPQRPRQQLTLLPSDFPRPPRVGDRLTIGIRENYLQQTSLLLYALPLAGLIGGALLGNWLVVSLWAHSVNSDPASLLGGGLGLVATLWLARHWAGSRERGMRNAIQVVSQTSPAVTSVSLELLQRSSG